MPMCIFSTLEVLDILSSPSTSQGVIGRPWEQSCSFTGMARSGGLHPRTYVSCPDRQSPLVYAACTRRQPPHTDTVTGRQRLQLPRGRCSRMHSNVPHIHPRHKCMRAQNRNTVSGMHRLVNGICTHKHEHANTHNSCFLSLAGTTTQASLDPGILWPTCSRHMLLTGLCHRWDVYSSAYGVIYRIISLFIKYSQKRSIMINWIPVFLLQLVFILVLCLVKLYSYSKKRKKKLMKLKAVYKKNKEIASKNAAHKPSVQHWQLCLSILHQLMYSQADL